MVTESVIEVQETLACYHCGQPCDETLWLEDKPFCCHGCQTVYEILSANQLCEYYSLDKNPGWQMKDPNTESYHYLDEAEIRKKLLEFESDNLAKITFHIPSIHCVSCIWLLEKLRSIEPGVLHTEVNFSQKKVTLDFHPGKITLSRIAQLLSSLGYAPSISLRAEEKREETRRIDRSLIIKIAIAGFCFGNVMMFSFPEYLGIDESENGLATIFSWLNLALSLPVLLYSGRDYLTSAAKSFRQRQINIDVPIAVGLLALFFRSAYDIVTATGPGYLDSFTGLVFFLLIGRWFQSKTYESLAFDRDYSAYFPLAINRLERDEWKPIVIYQLERKDIIQVRNMEIIPADSTLLAETAYIDYSFVTGESKPVKVMKGDLVYAGGRLIGAPATLVVEKKTSQSHLTSLWNHDAFRKGGENRFQKIIDRAARVFTWVVLGIAAATALYWQATDPSATWLVITSVLMVACPCALALAAPFTYGNMLRAFGKNHLYLKNADVIERMANIDTVVFDKTGTVTHGGAPAVNFTGTLSREELSAVKMLTSYSTHPLSKLIAKALTTPATGAVSGFKEIPGKGIEGLMNDALFKIGSAAFIGSDEVTGSSSTRVYVSVDGIPRGYFSIRTSVREDLSGMLRRLSDKCVALLSGDQPVDRTVMQKLFEPGTQLLFNQSPHDKLHFIQALQQQGRKVLMVGDGLNDAGALKQSDVGIAVTEDSGIFTPASDGILYGNQLYVLDRFLALAKSSSLILKTGFGISFFYNAVALSFAVSGHLTPLVAAILMPVSSISVVGFTTLAVKFFANRTFRTIKHQAHEIRHR